jgi:hypothetical protein
MTSMRAPGQCQYCGEVLTDIHDRGRSKEYCCDRCRSAARRRRRAEDPGLVPNDFAAALHAAIEASGQPARSLAMQVTAAGQALSSPSLSEWRAGKSIPYLNERTREGLLALERLVPTPPGALLAALERTARERGKGGWHDRQRPAPPSRGPAALQAKFEAQGITNRGSLALVESREVYSVGGDRLPRSARNAYRLCALRPGVERYFAVFTVDDRSPVTVEPGLGCHLGPLRRLRSRRYSMVAAELRLNRTLEAYELVDLEFSVVNPMAPDGDRLPMPGWIHVVRDPACRLAQMTLCFSGQHPKKVWSGSWKPGPGGVPTPEQAELVTSDDGHFALELTNPRPAWWGFRWQWPGAMETAALAGAETR